MTDHMTGPEHYREAERLLATAVPGNLNRSDDQRIAAAQVHATLAQAAAQGLLAALAAYDTDGDVLEDAGGDWELAVTIAGESAQ